MPHILLIWELGEDLGHLARLSKLAEAFMDRGHKVTLAAKDLSRANVFFRESRARLIQSPVWLPRLKRPRLTKTLADILAYKGYGDVEGLSALVKAWRTLLEDAKPDLVIFDYAPTALLASRNLPIPRVIVSNSYSFPVPGIPVQDICPWIKAPFEAMQRNEQRVVDNVNQVAKRHALPAIHCIADLYEHDAAFHADLPEFDPFAAERTAPVYVGPPSNSMNFQACDWGSGGGKRVFVYLKPGRQHVDAALKTLAKSNAIVRGYYAGTLTPELRALASPSFQLSGSPLDMAASLKGADKVVAHAGVGTVCDALLAGKPLFGLPTQIEQTFNAHQISDLGVGNWAGRDDDESNVATKLSAFLANAESEKRARTFAQLNAHYANINFEDTVVEGCEKRL
ncbi:glycosyltransferase [Marinobacter sp. NFXS9]|uniref:glycosyltransferase n=1 Tax=Marinobacter sp. NFXS9 TaxID=2818433 RepID=UPI0032DE7467